MTRQFRWRWADSQRKTAGKPGQDPDLDWAADKSSRDRERANVTWPDDSHQIWKRRSDLSPLIRPIAVTQIHFVTATCLGSGAMIFFGTESIEHQIFSTMGNQFKQKSDQWLWLYSTFSTRSPDDHQQFKLQLTDLVWFGQFITKVTLIFKVILQGPSLTQATAVHHSVRSQIFSREILTGVNKNETCWPNENL